MDGFCLARAEHGELLEQLASENKLKDDSSFRLLLV